MSVSSLEHIEGEQLAQCAHAPCRGSINSPFGPRRGIQDRTVIRQHQGADLAGRIGDPVYAAAAGIVEHVTENGARGFGCYGRVIVIAHPQWGEDRTLYAHLSSQSVREGERVEAGQIIGAIGNTNGSESHPGTTFADGSCSSGGGFTRGRARGSGPHLHFEAAPRRYPMTYDASRYDPIEWLGDRGIVYERGRLVTASSCPHGHASTPASSTPRPGAAQPRRPMGGGAAVIASIAGSLVALAASKARRG